MKKIGLYLGALLMMVLTLASCSKEFTPGDPDTMTTGAYVKEIAAGSDLLKIGEIATSVVTKTIGQVGAPISQVSIYAAASATLNKANWKLIKTLPFTEGMELSVTGAEIASALGVDAESLTGPVLYQEVTTTDGRVFNLATNTPSNFESFPNYHMAMQWRLKVLCPWDRDFFSGSFEVLSDGWNDYSPGATVQVSPGPGPNQVTIALYPPSGDRTPIVIDVDPETGDVTVPEQVYGGYGPGYENFSALGTGSISACTGIISLDLEHYQGGGYYGLFTVELKKL